MKFYALIAIISVIGLYSVTNRNLKLEETGKKDYSKIVYCAPDFDPDKIDGFAFHE